MEASVLFANINALLFFHNTRLCKTYHSFRTLASHLKKIAEKGANKIKGPITRGSIPKVVGSAIIYADAACQLVNSERYEHFGKVCKESCSKLDGTIACIGLVNQQLCFYVVKGELHICQIHGEASKANHQ
jgi:hypothetical protein